MDNVLEIKSKNHAENIMQNFVGISDLIQELPGMVKNEMGLNRQQFRNMKRDQKKAADVIKGFTKTQKDTIQMMLKSNEKYYMNRIGDYATAMTAAVNATLHDMLEGQYTKDVAEKFWNEANELAIEHLEKSEGKTISMEEWREMEQRVKDFIFKGLADGISAGELKKDLKFKFPALTGAQVKNAYAEAKEEYDAINKITNIIEEPKKPRTKKATKKEPITMTKEAGEQLEEIVEELKSDGKAIEIAVEEVKPKEVDKVVEETTVAVEDERYIPAEVVKATTIPEFNLTEQLKSKLVMVEGKRVALKTDIENCEDKIKELENIIKDKRKGISEYEVKAKNIHQMIELAKTIE